MANYNEIITIISDSSTYNNNSDSDNNSSNSASTSQISTSEEIFYSSPECKSSKGPSKSLLKWYEYLSDEYKDNDRFWGSKSGGSKAKVQASGSKAKIQASMAKASGSKAQASPKTLIVKSPVPITNCVLRLTNAKTWDAILSKTFGVKIPPTMTCVEEKKGNRKIIDDRKGPSIASVPKEGPSIQGLLDGFGYDTIKEYQEETYFPSIDKDITNKDSTDEDTLYESYSPMSK
ncbi:hypothetical protein Tco_1268870, partial [Tanacetum coccineum]